MCVGGGNAPIQARATTNIIESFLFKYNIHIAHYLQSA